MYLMNIFCVSRVNILSILASKFTCVWCRVTMSLSFTGIVLTFGSKTLYEWVGSLPRSNLKDADAIYGRGSSLINR